MVSKNPLDSSASPPVAAVMEALAAPFDPREVRFKPAVVSGQRALALAYVDARVIQDRLDSVLGVAGWQDEYECLPDGSVVCRLRLRLGEEWITKMDVGGPSEQPDEGDRRKAAFSDALKRAAVKFGVGRYLYRLPSQWVDYDPQKRQFVRPPTVPAGRSGEPSRTTSAAPQQRGVPANGMELQRRVQAHDARLAREGICRAGELIEQIVRAGVEAGHEADLASWSGAAITLAIEQARTFEAERRRQKREAKEVA